MIRLDSNSIKLQHFIIVLHRLRDALYILYLNYIHNFNNNIVNFNRWTYLENKKSETSKLRWNFIYKFYYPKMNLIFIRK